MAFNYTDLQEKFPPPADAEPMLTLQFFLENPEPADYNALMELIGRIRYHQRPLRLTVEAPLTDADLQSPRYQSLKPRPAYYPADRLLAGPVDFESEPTDLLENLMLHLERITGWQVIGKHFPQNLPAALRHRLYAWAARHWISPDANFPELPALEFPEDPAVLTAQLENIGIALEDLFPEIERPEPTGQDYLNAPDALLFSIPVQEFVNEYENQIDFRKEDPERPPLPEWNNLPAGLRKQLLASAAELLAKRQDWDLLQQAVFNAVAEIDQRSQAEERTD